MLLYSTVCVAILFRIIGRQLVKLINKYVHRYNDKNSKSKKMLRIRHADVVSKIIDKFWLNKTNSLFANHITLYEDRQDRVVSSKLEFNVRRNLLFSFSVSHCGWNQKLKLSSPGFEPITRLDGHDARWRFFALCDGFVDETPLQRTGNSRVRPAKRTGFTDLWLTVDV